MTSRLSRRRGRCGGSSFGTYGDAADLTDDQRRRVLFTGLRAFDGRRDLEVHGC